MYNCIMIYIYDIIYALNNRQKKHRKNRKLTLKNGITWDLVTTSLGIRGSWGEFFWTEPFVNRYLSLSKTGGSVSFPAIFVAFNMDYCKTGKW